MSVRSPVPDRKFPTLNNLTSQTIATNRKPTPITLTSSQNLPKSFSSKSIFRARNIGTSSDRMPSRNRFTATQGTAVLNRK